MNPPKNIYYDYKKSNLNYQNQLKLVKLDPMSYSDNSAQSHNLKDIDMQYDIQYKYVSG